MKGDKLKERILQVHPELSFVKFHDNGRSVYCNSEYGMLLLDINLHIYKKHKYTIDSSLDKSKFWSKTMTKLIGDKYDYSKVVYTGRQDKIIIICKEHGEFLQSPNDHMFKKAGCPKCGIKINSINNTETKESFILKANKIHNYKYDYSNIEYVNCNTPTLFICSIHGEFVQKPSRHLQTAGCPVCGKLNNIGFYNTTTARRNILEYGFKKASVYIFRLYNEYESFYKIGITKNKASYRKHLIPYSCKILHTYDTTLLNAILMEQKLHNKLKKYRYKPNIYFAGHTECFYDISKININKFKNGIS